MAESANQAVSGAAAIGCTPQPLHMQARGTSVSTICIGGVLRAIPLSHSGDDLGSGRIREGLEGNGRASRGRSCWFIPGACWRSTILHYSTKSQQLDSLPGLVRYRAALGETLCRPRGVGGVLAQSKTNRRKAPCSYAMSMSLSFGIDYHINFRRQKFIPPHSAKPLQGGWFHA